MDIFLDGSPQAKRIPAPGRLRLSVTTRECFPVGANGICIARAGPRWFHCDGVVSDAAQRKERDLVGREMEHLRCSVQTVCRSALPLGKIMDYIQEDMDSMQAELLAWRRENQQHAQALQQEQRATDHAVEPLQIELAELDQLIRDQQDRICAVKSNILRNEEKIHKMVTKAASWGLQEPESEGRQRGRETAPPTDWEDRSQGSTGRPWMGNKCLELRWTCRDPSEEERGQLVVVLHAGAQPLPPCGRSQVVNAAQWASYLCS
ncbi:hypothetical protein CRUP_015097 [Coryphaenoides rupestris]|nr:hypothetical protein CRUP_015097 [Coryphaenoides rupestris]